MRIEYKGKGKYKDWVDSMWRNGFDYPITKVETLLGVSKQWISTKLLKEINYVVYDYSQGYGPKNIFKTWTYIRKEDLSDWIKKNATFEVQTEVVDLYYYLTSYKTIANKALKMHKELKPRNKLNFRTGVVSDKLLEYINSELKIIGASKNTVTYKRSEIPFKTVEPFDIFERENDLYTVDNQHTKDWYYSHAFQNGDIKIKIGERITIFVKNHPKTEQMKIPFIVPKDQKIRVLSKKKK